MYPKASCIMTIGLLSLTLVAGEETVERAPTIATQQGQVSGIVEEAISGNAFYSYYAIPFAKPPVGELRLKDPVEAESWKGVRDGASLPSPCLQVPFGAVMMGMQVPPEGLLGEEDCLYLNVFTPKVVQATGQLPVMVFIHGGGYFAGASNEYLPHVLLSKEIILVTIQYRLGFLGFLSTEDPVIPGNYGLKDQTLALQWVQTNIGHFGGDPKRVTIFGESAGAASVHYQMLTPKAKGLFSGAIMQSGNAMCPWALSAQHKKVAEKVSSLVGCNTDEGSQELLQCLQAVDGNKLVATLQDIQSWCAFPLVSVPRVDDDYLPGHPSQMMQEGNYNKVNIISGITAQEGAIFVQPMFVRDDLLSSLENNFEVNGPLSLQWYASDEDHYQLTQRVYQHYLGGLNLGAEKAEDMSKMLSDVHFNYPHDLLSDIHAREKDVSTFTYELAHRSQLSTGDLFNAGVGTHWVSHGDDLYYLFRGGPLLQPPIPGRLEDLQSPEDLTLRDSILTLWANFATHGHPSSGEALGFSWEAKSPRDLRHLQLSSSPAMTSDTREEVRHFLSSLPTTTNRFLDLDLELDDDGFSTESMRLNLDEL